MSSADVGGVALHDELRAIVDERTLRLVEQRRHGSVLRTRGWLVRRLLFAADVMGLFVAMVVAEWLVNRHNGVGALDTRGEMLAFVVSLPAWVVIAKLYGLYDRDEERTDHSTADDFAGVFHMVTVCTFLFWGFAYVTRVAHPTPPKLLIFWGSAVGLVFVGRAIARSLARRSVAYIQNTVIVGAGDVGQLVAKKVLSHPEYGINLVGFIDGSPKKRRDDLEHLALLGDTDRIPAIVRLFDIERVIVAFSNDSHEEMLQLLRELRDLDVQIDLVPRLFELLSPGVGIHTVEGLPLLGLPPARLPRSSKLLKRGMDLVITVPAAVVLLPFFLLMAALIRLDSPGPALFRQVRMGASDQTFRIFKFRTMHADADQQKEEFAHLNKHARRGGDARMFKIDDDPRVTRVGRVLRRFSLDELPQLWNVLRGEMSLVGPRPLILEEHAHVVDWAERRLDLRPGITGLWQVLGRDEIPFSEMVKLDYIYVTSWSLARDLQLVARTVPLVLRNAG